MLLPMLAMAAYVWALIAYAGTPIGLWDSALVADAVAWAIATGFALFGSATTLFNRPSSLRRLVLKAVGLTALVEVFVNLYVFPLPIELILLPALALLATMSVVAGTEDRFATLGKLIDGAMTIVGFSLFTYVAIRLLTEWDSFDQALGLQKLALPIWLTIGVLPFVLVLGVCSAYDSAFSMIRWASDERGRRLRARLALIVGLHLQPRSVTAFSGLWCKELTAARSWRDAMEVVRRFRQRDAAALPV